LSTKGVASLLSYTLFKALTFPITYLLVLVLVFTAVMQIKYVNRALQHFEATQVIPTQFVLFTLSVIIGSAVLYRDFETTPGEDAGKFIGGCALTFLGVWLITSARQSPLDDDDEDDEFDEADEDAIILRPGDIHQVDSQVNKSQASLASTRRSTTGSSADELQRNSSSLKDDPQSQLSFPDTLERNHWDSASESGQPAISVTGPTSTASLESRTREENPWEAESPRPALKQKSSLRRIIEPLTSLLPYSNTPVAQSTPSLPSEADSIPTNYTPVGTYADPSLLGRSLPHHDHERMDPALHRRSLASLYPGPFTSPLSASLSAVIADSIRRSHRRRRSTRTPLPDENVFRTGNLAESELPLGATDQEYPEPVTPSRMSSIAGPISGDEESETGTPRVNTGRRKSFGERISSLFRSGSRSQKRPENEHRASNGV
jgi:hypothetical protein